MKDVYSPPRQRPHTPGEVQGFHEVRDREAHGFSETVKSAVGTLGVPFLVAEVLKIGTPVLVMGGSELLRALHPESPGGPKLTDQELQQLAYHAGRELERRLLAELAHLVTERVQHATADGPPGVDAGPTPLIDPASLVGRTATLTTIPPESTLDPGPVLPMADPPKVA